MADDGRGVFWESIRARGEARSKRTPKLKQKQPNAANDPDGVASTAGPAPLDGGQRLRRVRRSAPDISPSSTSVYSLDPSAEEESSPVETKLIGKSSCMQGKYGRHERVNMLTTLPYDCTTEMPHDFTTALHKKRDCITARQQNHATARPLDHNAEHACRANMRTHVRATKPEVNLKITL